MLEREVSEVEVFIEAVPSVFVMTFFIIFGSVLGKSFIFHAEYNEKAADLLQALVFGEGVKKNLFYVTYFTSILTASLGIAKCLKVGPCRILPEGGALGGLGTGRFLLILFSVALTLICKIVLVFLLIQEFQVYHNLARQICITFSLMIFPQLLLAFVSLCRDFTIIPTILSHPSLLLLPVFSYFTFASGSPTLLSNCLRRQGEEKDLQIHFSHSWTLANIVLSFFLGLVMMLLWGEIYFLLTIFSTLGTVIFLFLGSDCCNENCCVCLPLPQISVLCPSDPHTELVMVEDNCGKQSVVTLEQWRQMDQENWRNMELHDYQYDEREGQDDSIVEIEMEVLSQLQRRSSMGNDNEELKVE